MIENDGIMSRAERDLRDGGALSPETCAAYQNAEPHTRAWLKPCFDFLGCWGDGSSIGEDPVLTCQRVGAVRLMLLRLGVHTTDPRWSSDVLESLVGAALTLPGSQVADIVRATIALLAETNGKITDSQAHFARDVGIQVVGRQRRRYAEEDFAWLRDVILDREGAVLTPAQAYFAAYVLPPAYTPECGPVILRALASTRYTEEIEQLLEE